MTSPIHPPRARRPPFFARIAGAAAIFLAARALSAAGVPATRAQLREMLREKVAPGVIRAIVDRDCVDFDVTAANAVELSRELPSDLLEAILRCRRTLPDAEVARSNVPAATPHFSTVPAPPIPKAPTNAELRLRALFIAESSPLSCSCQIDDVAVATLQKGPQGEFGENVPRTKIARESGFLRVAPGRHVVRFRCDPHDQEISVSVDVGPSGRQTVEIAESAFRRWKLRRIEKN